MKQKTPHALAAKAKTFPPICVYKLSSGIFQIKYRAGYSIEPHKSANKQDQKTKKQNKTKQNGLLHLGHVRTATENRFRFPAKLVVQIWQFGGSALQESSTI